MRAGQWGDAEGGGVDRGHRGRLSRRRPLLHLGSAGAHRLANPSATEILFAVGAGDDVVGVTFECDHPPAARERRIVSTSAMPKGLTPREIDDFVAAAMTAGEDLYRFDAGALAELDADLVVTQDLCAVCAVDVGTSTTAQLPRLPGRGRTLDPHTLDDMLATIVEVGRLTGRSDEAAAWSRPRHASQRWPTGSPLGHARGSWCWSGPTRRSRRDTGSRDRQPRRRRAHLGSRHEVDRITGTSRGLASRRGGLRALRLRPRGSAGLAQTYATASRTAGRAVDADGLFARTGTATGRRRRGAG